VAEHSMNLRDWLRKQLEEADSDLLRDMVQTFAEQLMDAQVKREEIEELPLYPEERVTHRPTAEQILRLYSLTQRHHLYENDRKVQVFEPELTDLQRQVLYLLGVPETAYCRGR
jgi:hypothetical protein